MPIEPGNIANGGAPGGSPLKLPIDLDVAVVLGLLARLLYSPPSDPDTLRAPKSVPSPGELDNPDCIPIPPVVFPGLSMLPPTPLNSPDPAAAAVF
jgi:hypothetical protein